MSRIMLKTASSVSLRPRGLSARADFKADVPMGDLASGRYEALLAAVLDDAGLRGPATRSPARSRRPSPDRGH